MVPDGHREMEGWGVFSVFKEAGRLLDRHVRILRPFLLAFLFPLALILFLEVVGIALLLASVAWLTQLAQPRQFGGILGYYRRRHSGFHAFHVGFVKAPTPLESNPYSFIIKLILRTYTLTFLILFITWLLASLATTTIAKAIRHIYSQNISSTTTISFSPINDSSSSFQIQIQALTLIHSIFTTLPHFIYRIFIITLCFFVVDIFTYFILALPFYLFSGPQLFPYPLETINISFSYFLFLVLDSWFEVSIQVAMLKVY